MDFDEQMELGHFVLTERKCRVCGKVKELIDGFYLIRKNKGNKSSYSYECKTCTISRVKKSKKKISNKNKCKYKIDYIANGEAFLTKPEKTIFLAKKIIKRITKINPKFSTTGGTSDARFIKKIAPCLEFGLVNKTMHKVDECVSLTDLKKLTKIYTNILVEYFK